MTIPPRVDHAPRVPRQATQARAATGNRMALSVDSGYRSVHRPTEPGPVGHVLIRAAGGDGRSRARTAAESGPPFTHREEPMATTRARSLIATLGAVLLLAGANSALAETPKRGGTLTYLIPADAPPSFDGHRETTFATVHTAAPFYSVLVRS